MQLTEEFKWGNIGTERGTNIFPQRGNSWWHKYVFFLIYIKEGTKVKWGSLSKKLILIWYDYAVVISHSYCLSYSCPFYSNYLPISSVLCPLNQNRKYWLQIFQVCLLIAFYFSNICMHHIILISRKKTTLANILTFVQSKNPLTQTD